MRHFPRLSWRNWLVALAFGAAMALVAVSLALLSMR